MSTSMHHRHHFGVKCRVDGCGDFVRVKKHGLCITHYYRWRATGRTEVLATERPCAMCGELMKLVGFAVQIKRFCSDRCYSAEKRRLLNLREGHRAKRARYQYAWKLKNDYGISEEDYRRIHEAQLGLCPICFRSEEEIGERLCVDHDHANGRVRGLLCRKCNKAVGGFDESLERLSRAIEYLNSPTVGVAREPIAASGDNRLTVEEGIAIVT